MVPSTKCLWGIGSAGLSAKGLTRPGGFIFEEPALCASLPDALVPWIGGRSHPL